MRRSVAFRMAAFWAAMLLALTWGGDAFAIHACPHHLAAGQQGGYGGSATEMPAGHGAHHAPTSGEHSRQHDGACTCIGSCIAGSVLPPLVPSEVAFRVAIIEVAPPMFATEPAALPGRAPYLLPYATPPPVVA